MQSLRDQLLKAGLVTAEQAERSANADRKRQGRGGRGGEGRGDGPKPERTPDKAGDKAQDKPADKPKAQPPRRPNNGPIPRMIDLSDPVRLKILQAIEAHRFRGDPQGDQPFYFTLRDGRVRKLFVNPAVSKELEGGVLAIVENGDADQHIIVAAEAVSAIRDADPEAVRFSNR